MPKDATHRFTAKQHRQAMHIKEGYLNRGFSEEEAERLAWMTVNKEKSGYRAKLSDLRSKR
jgi:hypothetical protein